MFQCQCKKKKSKFIKCHKFLCLKQNENYEQHVTRTLRPTIIKPGKRNSLEIKVMHRKLFPEDII